MRSPVPDIDRAKNFYVNQVGYNADYDVRVNESLRFVQLTPPGSACSICLGEGITDMEPGSQRGLQIVVPNTDDARKHQQRAPFRTELGSKWCSLMISEPVSAAAGLWCRG